MTSLMSFAGRLHPVIVHLPIGIILLALLLELLSLKARREHFKPAADLALGLGVLAAAFSCCSGYLLSLNGDYDASLVTVHQWLAISLTFVSACLYFLLRGKRMNKLSGGVLMMVVLLLFLTGHWGGSLTHGPDYLTIGLQKDSEGPTLRPVADIQSANVYNNMVQPVLHDNCYRCHSAGHIKGGLRLDGPDVIMKGGKDGPVILPGNPSMSLLLRRILLPVDDDHHMAPKDKPQLTAAEVKLLEWWIQTGASFSKTVNSLPQDDSIHSVLAAFHEGTAGPVAGVTTASPNVADSDMPFTTVVPAPPAVIRRLEAAGALVLPIAEGSNYLSVSFPSDTLGKDALQALPLLKEQLVSLKCSFVPAGDEILVAAAACTHLVRLWVDHTLITGQNFAMLHTLTNLRYLNLTSTQVTAAEVLSLKSLPKLTSLYVYQTKVNKPGWDSLHAAFKHTSLDSGGYDLPFLVTDTAIVRSSYQKK
jgi:uncharacterized membrane protein/mono/diheme cytochrome c family protein